MENEIICLDTSVLIDYFRKKDKQKSVFFKLTTKYKLFAVSIVTEYEIMVGANSEKTDFWNQFFEKITVLPLNKSANGAAIRLTKLLRASNKLIEVPDIFIGATAMANNMKIATLNKKHFERMQGLKIVEI
jgi:predicted nucleic acid-binding protein